MSLSTKLSLKGTGVEIPTPLVHFSASLVVLNFEGGFHCLHKLKFQSSEKAYKASGGACRPASQGPFPLDNCKDQCRIGASAKHKES